MDIWSVLGIEATKDKDELKKAYRRKLAKTNPEDNPDGFMELRNAYEEAVRLADSEEIAEEDNADGDRLTAKIKAIYGSYWDRVNPEKWGTLFNQDEFVSLDTSEEAFDKLMRFLMENFCIPKNVWVVICDTFDIAARRKELKNTYPEDFIEYVINNATYEDLLDYQLFEGDEKYFDRYIELYYKLDTSLRRKELDKQLPIIEELEALDVYHPYLEICKIRHEIQKVIEDDEENDEVEISDANKELFASLQERADLVYSDNPKDTFIINCCGDVALIRRDYEKAKEYYDISYEIAPDNYMVKGKQAEINYYLGEYEKSRDMYMDLLKINHYDNNVRVGMIKANQGIIDKNQKLAEEDPTNLRAKMEIGWSLYQSYRFEEGIKVLESFEPDDAMVFEYNNLKGRTYLCLERYEEALECFFKWKKAIEDIPDEDTSEEATKNRKRYEYTNFLIGDCYLKLKQFEKAKEFISVALKKDHEELVLSLEAMCELEYELGDMEKCLISCENLLDKDPRSYIGYDFMSKAYYRMGYANETLSACEQAIAIYPYVSNPYSLEAKIFLKLDRIDTARKIVERYREFGIDSDKIDYTEAQILATEKDYQSAIALMVKAINRSDAYESDMEYFGDLYLMLGELYEQVEEPKNAITVYKKLIELEPDNSAVYGRLGILYRDEEKLEDALEMLTKQLELRPSAYYYISRAIIYRYNKKYDEAIADYKEALIYEPQNVFCHTRLGNIYEIEGMFEAAIRSFDNALQYMDNEDENSKQKRANLIACKARVYQCMVNFEESESCYKQYLEEFGDTADILYDYSELLLRMSRYEDAAIILRRAIDNLPYDTDIQMCIRQLIFVYGTEGYLSKANEALELAISKDPLDARAYGSMASAFRNRGLYSEAKKLYQKAVLVNEKRAEKGLSISADYNAELAEVIILEKGFFKQNIDLYLKKGYASYRGTKTPFGLLKKLSAKKAEKKTKDALALADKALKLNRCEGCFYSRCHEALFEKALIYEAMKEYELALICYKEALRIVGHHALYEEKIKRIESNDSRNRSRNDK